jgi:aryl-alcohol dehydrogenase
LTIEQFDVDEPAPNEIAVRIAATGVCRTDLHIRDGGPGVASALDSLAMTGTVVMAGAAPAGTRTSLDMNALLNGRAVRGTIQGDAEARKLVPLLIELYQQGRFPVGRLVGNYRFAEIQRAIADMENGRVIKPILRMTDDEKDCG